MRKIADRSEAGENLEALAQFDVDAGEAATDRSGDGTFQSYTGAFDRFGQFPGNVLLVFFKGFAARSKTFPFKFDASGFEDANSGVDDFGANAVAGNEGYLMSHKNLDRVIGSSGHRVIEDQKPMARDFDFRSSDGRRPDHTIRFPHSSPSAPLPCSLADLSVRS